MTPVKVRFRRLGGVGVDGPLKNLAECRVASSQGRGPTNRKKCAVLARLEKSVRQRTRRLLSEPKCWSNDEQSAQLAPTTITLLTVAKHLSTVFCARFDSRAHLTPQSGSARHINCLGIASDLGEVREPESGRLSASRRKERLRDRQRALLVRSVRLIPKWKERAMIRVKKILVPTDFSPHSGEAMKYACTLAEQFNAELHLLHVVELLPVAYYEGAVFTAESEEKMREAAEKLLHKQPEPPWKDSLKVVYEVRQGTPFHEVVGYAKDNNIDLIVMGTHGRTGLGHVLLGSVAERVVRKAPCAVLTVRNTH